MRPVERGVGAEFVEHGCTLAEGNPLEKVKAWRNQARRAVCTSNARLKQQRGTIAPHMDRAASLEFRRAVGEERRIRASEGLVGRETAKIKFGGGSCPGGGRTLERRVRQDPTL